MSKTTNTKLATHSATTGVGPALAAVAVDTNIILISWHQALCLCDTAALAVMPGAGDLTAHDARVRPRVTRLTPVKRVPRS
jgi:hypothetical protein